VILTNDDDKMSDKLKTKHLLYKCKTIVASGTGGRMSAGQEVWYTTKYCSLVMFDVFCQVSQGHWAA